MSLWAFAVRRWQFTLVLFALLIAMGISNFRNMPRSEDPTFNFPAADLIIAWPGASAEDVEQRIVKPVEDAVNSLENLKRIVSRAGDGLAVLHIEFYYGQDPEKKYDEVVREFNALRSQLPTDLAGIEIRRANPGLVNIVQIALLSDTADYRELQKRSEDLKDLLKGAPGVRQSEVWALPKPEVRVAIDLQRLAGAGVTLGQVIQAVQGENANIPGGAVDVGLRRYNLKTSGPYDSLDEIKATVIAARDGRVVHLGDLAEISWSTEEQRYVGRFKGKRAVFITANAKDNENIFRVREGIYERIAEFEKTLPAHMHLERGFDQSRNVDRRLSRLGHDFAIAIALVLITLLPLGLRAAGVVMISIPLSLAVGLSALYFAGFSLNQLSIAGFVVALGLLVDDSIVVVENIARFIRNGHSRMEAAIKATDQIYLAVLGCTATLLLAFVPLLFLPEGAGQFIRSLPAAVLFTILASLFISLTIVPFLSSRMLRNDAAHEDNTHLNWFQRIIVRFDALADRLLSRVMRAIHEIYAPALRWALHRPRATLLAALAVFLAAIATVPLIGFSVFPNADVPQFLVRVDAPNGSSLAETDRALRFVETELARRPEVKRWFTNLGRGNPFIYYNIVISGEDAERGEIFAELYEYDTRRTPQMFDELREKFRAYPGARITLKQFENGPPIDAPIAVRVIGPELPTLRRIAGEVEQLFKATPGTRDVNNPVRLQGTELNLGIDTEKAALLGVPAVEADRTVRLAVAGMSAGKYHEADGDEYDITLRLPMAGRPDVSSLDQIQVSTLSGKQIPLRQIADPELRSVPNAINRYNRERIVTVTAYPQTGYNTGKVTDQIVANLDKMKLPPGYRLKMAGEVEASEESFSGLGPAMLVALFGIFAVLVLEFGSFRSTLIVAGVIPLGLTGALLALLVTGYTLSFTAVIGMIALIGIEIKNSILLVDFTNQLRGQGVSLDDAIEQAGEIRFFPILLTSLTAIGGLLPLATQGSGLYSPLAVVIIGGLLSSTLLARLVTPVMYKLLPPDVLPRSAA